MEKTIRILAVLLVIQVALAVGLQFTGTDLTAAPKAGPLVQFKPDNIDRIVIAGGSDEELELTRGGDGWILPAADGFPADPAKAEQLLARIKGLDGGDVIARTRGARTRFQVAPDDFKRRITLFTGEKKRAQLFFGSSPGKDRIHVRREGENRIHVVRFGTYDAPVELSDWRDKTLLQIPEKNIAGVVLGNLRIKRTEAESGSEKASTAWEAVDAPSGQAVQASAMDRLTQRLAGLRIAGVLGEEEPEGYDWNAPVLDLRLERRDGEPVRLRVAQKSGKKNQAEYALKASSRTEYFRLASPVADQLIEAASRKQLLGKARTSKESTETEAHGSGDTG